MEDMSITPLGSGQEVGRSCHLLEFRGMTILLDCGIHPGYDGLNGLPFFDRVEPERVDVLLITHFHLDHAASLPYFTERTGFRGRIFMTHPTKAVIRLLLGDYLRLMTIKKGGSSGSGGGGDDKNDSDELYTEEDLIKCCDKIELIDYHQTISVGGLKFRALNAGHVLGAAMFLLEIGGRTLLYTGDYSMEDDRHLMAAEVPNVKPDVLMVESTYGVQIHASRAEREARFTGTVERVVTRGGKCLIPVFALGRAQELLLILDEHWQANPHLQSIPVWYASKMASRALRVYQTYANMMNARIRAQMDVSNPFSFRYIRNLKSIDVESFDDRGPSVVFASPGMLQSGVSRKLFDRWATDPKNGVLIAGYAVENTLAKEIMNQPKEVVTLEGRRQPLHCLVDYVSFSAHVDFMENRNFISRVDPKHIILVHGQKDEMGRLKSALMLHYRQLPENKRPTITMPPNLQEVKLKFARRRSAKVMGSLADREEEPKEGEQVRGILVTQNFSTRIVAPKDLSTYTQLRVGSVSSKLHVPFAAQVATLRLFLKEMFSGVTEVEEGGGVDGTNVITFGLHEDQVKVTTGKTRGVATVSWDASPAGDILADAVVALLMHAQSSVASIRLTSKPCGHRRKKAAADEEEPATKRQRESEALTVVESRLRLVHDTLLESYEDVEATYEANSASFEIQTDTGLETGIPADGGILVCTVKVDFGGEGAGDAKITVECEDAKLATNVKECIKNVLTAVAPIHL
mmetsp:Transcript_20983/g.45759  ORF Transcript_20983/g.45759 Transcript_20983/m.45759 type:complete len:746 (+) Transcript_20983:225-2462(+)